MTGKVFISYRREDSQHAAGRIHDRLASEFAPDNLFMDVDARAIPLGAIFPKVIRQEVAKCDVFLVVIGTRWVDARDEAGNSRLHNANDFVRIEISTALGQGIPVIPLLIDGALMPDAAFLPKDLQGLTERQALHVRHNSFHSDVENLVVALRALQEKKLKKEGGSSTIARRSTIALADDERNHLTSLGIALETEGYKVRTYSNGQAAFEALTEEPADLAILDIRMPGMDGLELLRRLRQTTDMPVIFLTSKDEEIDELFGLRMGAEDYIGKPFSTRLVVERVKAVLRRFQPKEPGGAAAEAARVLERGKLQLNPLRHTCQWNGHPVMLTITEYLMVEALAMRPGVVKTRDALMDAAYDDQVYVDDRTIDSHIKRLRKKFKQADDSFDVIETLYGVGYRFKEA